MVYATVTDVEARYEGALSSEPYVQELLDEAHALLEITAPTVATRVEAGTLEPDLVKLVIRRAVLRVIRNPNGYGGEHAGEYGYYYRQGESGQSGEVEFTAADLALIGVTLPDPSKSKVRVGTITSVLAAHRQAPGYPDCGPLTDYGTVTT